MGCLRLPSYIRYIHALTDREGRKIPIHPALHGPWFIMAAIIFLLISVVSRCSEIFAYSS